MFNFWSRLKRPFTRLRKKLSQKYHRNNSAFFTPNPLDLVPAILSNNIISKYHISKRNLKSISSAQALFIKRNIKFYYNQTEALPFSRVEIKIIAHDIAKQVKQLYQKSYQHELQTYVSSIEGRFGLQKIELSDKVLNPKFWRQAISKNAQKQRENLAFDLGLITNNYCSSQAIEHYQQEQNANIAHIQNLLNSNDERSIKKALSISKRREKSKALIIAKIKGISNLKKQLELSAMMITITCPTSVRRINSIQGCIEYLKELQLKLSSFRCNHNLQLAGVNALEPHRNGLPHMHSYVIGSHTDLKLYLEYIYSLTSSLCSNTHVTWQKGDEATLAFYTVKSVCYPELETEAWYSAHNARRFNFFGLPSDEIWNMLRYTPYISNMKNKKFYKAQVAAKKGDHATFCQSVGGLATRRKDRPYSFLYETKRDTFNTVSKRRIATVIFGVKCSKRSTIQTLINIVTTKYSRCITTSYKLKKYMSISCLRSPPFHNIKLNQKLKLFKAVKHNSSI